MGQEEGSHRQAFCREQSAMRQAEEKGSPALPTLAGWGEVQVGRVCSLFKPLITRRSPAGLEHYLLPLPNQGALAKSRSGRIHLFNHDEQVLTKNKCRKSQVKMNNTHQEHVAMAGENSSSISSCKQNLKKQSPLFYRSRRQRYSTQKVSEMVDGNKCELEIIRKRNERKIHI